MPSITSWNRLEPQSRSADVGEGSAAKVHDPLWLLARQPDPAPDLVQEFLDEAARQMFDLTPLIRPQHTGREVTDKMLETRR